VEIKDEKLIRSKNRVAAYGEVFTPDQLVKEMLDLVEIEAERIDSRFLEPACGSGNFLIEILKRKLVTVDRKHKQNKFEKNNYSLLAIMSIYGIEILEDNAKECRQNLLQTLASYLKIETSDQIYLAAREIVNLNIVTGDAMNLSTLENTPIIFPEWSYLGVGKFQRRDFAVQNLTQRSSIKGSLFESLEDSEIFRPIREFNSLTVEEIGNLQAAC
tara:strand:- start:4180 stop:4827 length:648 start_codon:yes stop_codon:yes gene_type:complete